MNKKMKAKKVARNILSIIAIIMAIAIIFLTSNFVKKTQLETKAQEIEDIISETELIKTETTKPDPKRATAMKQFKIETAENLAEEIIEPEPETEPESEANAEPEREEVEVTEEGEYLGEFKITAYCPCYECSEGYGSQTAIGTYAQEGYTIAVDPNVIPLGSQIRFNGNVYTAEDVGGAVQGSAIDLYMESHEETINWGVQYMDVWLIN